MSAKLNEMQNASVGMTVGVIEVLCLQPLNYCKNMIQQVKFCFISFCFLKIETESIQKIYYA